MATYYVKKTGNDSNAGTSESLAWLTVTKAFQTAAAGDIVYIAPGIYREKPTVANSGTSGNKIKFIGDPDCAHFTNEKPGIVRITGCGTGEIPTSGTIITAQKTYLEFHNLHIDGNTSNYAITSLNVYLPLVKNCFFQNCYYGPQYCAVEDCVMIGCYYGMYYGTAKRTVIVGRYYCFANVQGLDSCIAIGGYRGFFYCTVSVINCTAIGCYVAFYFSGTSIVAVNCVAYSCYTAFNTLKAFNCAALACSIAFNGCIRNDCYYSGVSTVDSGTCSADSGYASPVEVSGQLFNFSKLDILKLFVPYLMTPLLNAGTSSQGTPPTNDVLNLTLQQGNGATPPIGAFGAHAYTLNFTSYYSTAPSIDFTTGGEKIFKFFAKAGVAFTKNVWTKYTPNGEDVIYPQLIARGDYITTQTDTGSTIDTWEQLTVSATPTKDCVIELIIKSRGTSTGDVTKFSDFS